MKPFFDDPKYRPTVQPFTSQTEEDAHYLGRMITDRNPLTDLRPKIAAHWRKYRPKMSAELAAAGKFDEVVETATRLTLAMADELMGGGLNPDTAWERCREEYALLPAEDDAPDDDDLPNGNPADWQAPLPEEDEDDEDEEGVEKLDPDDPALHVGYGL